MIFKKHFLILFVFLASSVFGQFTEFHPELNWYTIKGTHCVVHFHEGTERTARVVAKIADEVWGPITSLYEYDPGVVHFIIKDIDDYSNGATFFFDNKIEIWSSSLDFDLRGAHNWLRNVISHEYTHMVQIQASMKSTRSIPAFYLQWLNYEDKRRPDILYGYPNVIMSYPVALLNMPAWFAEGTAQYMRKEFNYDNWDSHRDMILRSYALDSKFLTWNQMGIFEKTSLGNESVYNSGFALTRYISQKYGEGKLRELAKSLGKLKNFTFDAAAKEVLGIDGNDLYNEWTECLTKDYTERMKAVQANLVEGTNIFNEGFGNFYPSLYDSTNLMFISNKGNDYLGQTAAYLLDLKTKKEKLIFPGVKSSISRIPGTDKILYSKLSEDNPGYANVHDIFTFDIKTEDEKRITNGLRANHPALSPDGKSIVFVFEKDGSSNIGTVDINGKNFKALTFWGNGEQISNPKFTPDGNNIIFDYSIANGRDIAMISAEGADFHFVLNEKYDERNPFLSKDSVLYYSCDETGIYNIYSLDLKSKVKKRLTNVRGGAFMPFVNSDGLIYYAGYTSLGYKLFSVTEAEQKNVIDAMRYIKNNNPPLGEDKPNNDINKFKIESLTNYNDRQIDTLKKEKYTGAFSKMSFFPVIRYDNYNTQNSFGQKMKLGVYAGSSDMLNRYSVFGGVMLNSKWERDMFFSFDYRNKLPLLYNIGLKPEITFELISISRKADATVTIPHIDTTSTSVTYNLFEVGVMAKHNFFSRFNFINFKYSYSSYSAALGVFPLTISGKTYTVGGSSDTYLLASNFEVSYKFDSYHPYLHSEINPVGAEIELKYNYELNRFNKDGTYSQSEGVLTPVYSVFNFHRAELNVLSAIKLFSSTALTTKLRIGSIMGLQAPEFFDYYLGGLIGMKEYPFYAVGGNKVAWLNMSYRFPVWKNIDTKVGHLYIDKVFLSVFGDFGNAWDGDVPKAKAFKKGVGSELRFALNSFYLFPTSVFFNACYGFDRVEKMVDKTPVKYGREFLFYAGILFDFNL